MKALVLVAAVLCPPGWTWSDRLEECVRLPRKHSEQECPRGMVRSPWTGCRFVEPRVYEGLERERERERTRERERRR